MINPTLQPLAPAGAKQLLAEGSSFRPVALVTGTSSGFGLLTALELAAAGYRVAAGLRPTSDRTELAARAEAAGVGAAIYPVLLDVTDEASVNQAVTAVSDSLGRLDLLVNNAGMAIGGFVEDIPLADWRLQMETNFIGLVAVTRAVLPHMRKQCGGAIINVSSISGRTGFPGFGPYSASKFAVEGFSEALRLEVAPWNIRVSVVEPGSYSTAIWGKGFDRLTADAGESPYRMRLQRLLAYTRQTAEQAADPTEVARLIARIARAKRPRLRYPAGRSTRLTLLAKSLLPWSWYERIIQRVLD